MKIYNFTIKTLSPITHTEEVSSNISSIYRQKIVIDNTIHDIPAVHGNAIRGVMRRLTANYLCSKVGVEKNSVKLDKYFILFNGGFLEKSLSFADIEEKRKLRDLMPILSVFGSAIQNEMLQGKLIVSFAVPRCKELGNSDISYNDLTQIIRYTRLDDSEQKQEGEIKTTQMFYDGEVLIQGSILDIEFLLDSENELEIAAFEKTLELLAEKPYIGGSSRMGHGKLDFTFKSEISHKYDQFLEDKKDEICKWLTS
jgi:hypothetical protein